tara:strand:- start:18 stop:137 length:120 start_codon:yes stop_codon:yes gene_type:complete
MNKVLVTQVILCVLLSAIAGFVAFFVFWWLMVVGGNYFG